MKRSLLVCFVIFTQLIITNAYANNRKNDTQEIRNIIAEWTEAFNRKDLSSACGLFSENLSADYQGVPTKNYQSVCDGFKKIFAQNKRSYNYHFKIHHIYRSNGLAAVRLTWYLKISENGKLISEVQDEGLDIIVKDKQGNWKIVNYLAFPVS